MGSSGGGAVWRLRAPDWRLRSGVSNRPEQFLQFEQIPGFLLPAFDANVPIEIAEPVKQKQRHKPALQREIHVSSRVSKSAKQTFNAARHSGSHESARAKQVVLAPSRHHVAEVDKPG